MKKAMAAAAALALLLVVGCQVGNVKELEDKIAEQTQKITELEGQVQMLTAEKDSLVKVIAEMEAKKSGTAKTPAGGGTQSNPPGKPPRTGR